MDHQDRNDQTLRHRKSRDRAIVLPLVGLILLLPPGATIFQLDTKIADLPFTLLYIFLVWVVLIAGAWAMAARLNDDPEPRAPDIDPRGTP